MIINCPSCGLEVSDTAIACIHCGREFGLRWTYRGASSEQRAKFRKSLAEGDVYFICRYDDAVFRSEPKRYEMYKKRRGGTEFSIDPSTQSVIDAMLQAEPITKEEYENF